MIQIKYWYRAITKRTNNLGETGNTYFSYETHDGAVYALNPSAAADIVELRITHDRAPDKRNIVLDSIVVRLNSENGEIALRTAPRFAYEAKDKALTRITTTKTKGTPFKAVERAAITQYDFPRPPPKWAGEDDDDEIPIHKYLTHLHKNTIHPTLKMEHFDGKD